VTRIAPCEIPTHAERTTAFAKAEPCHPLSLRERADLLRAATRPGQPERSRRGLGRIAVVVGFGLLVLWAVLTTIAERREVEVSVRSPPQGPATTPSP